jgi:uncharacterized SAM-binding protein YcdF (DUF218 family)
VPTNPPIPTRHRRYLRDRDVLHAGLVSLLALLLSGGVVWLAYLVHVCRVASRSPLVPPRRMVALVFGHRLERGEPDRDYRLRLQRALVLTRTAQTDCLFLLGGCSAGPRSEAAAGHAWLLRHGLPGRVQLALEQESSDSLENLRRARSLLCEQQADQVGLPPVALITSRYHLARCLMLARRLGFEGAPVAAEDALPHRPGYLLHLLAEASYLMWIDVGMRWADLIGHQRMSARIS